MMKRHSRLAFITLLVLASSSALAGVKIPEGVPFRTDYRAARREALRTGRPMFLYFTKTY